MSARLLGLTSSARAKEAEKQRKRRRTAAHTKRGKLGLCIEVNRPLLKYTKLDYISAFEAIVPVDASERKRGNQRTWRQTTTVTRAHGHHVTPKRTLN